MLTQNRGTVYTTPPSTDPIVLRVTKSQSGPMAVAAIFLQILAKHLCLAFQGYHSTTICIQNNRRMADVFASAITSSRLSGTQASCSTPSRSLTNRTATTHHPSDFCIPDRVLAT